MKDRRTGYKETNHGADSSSSPSNADGATGSPDPAGHQSPLLANKQHSQKQASKNPNPSVDATPPSHNKQGIGPRLLGRCWELALIGLEFAWVQVARPLFVGLHHNLVQPALKPVLVFLAFAAVGAGLATWMYSKWRQLGSYVLLDMSSVFAALWPPGVSWAAWAVGSANNDTTVETTATASIATTTLTVAALVVLVPGMQDFLRGVDYLGVMSVPANSLDQHRYLGALAVKEALDVLL
ncbi:hypothetical protein LZ30DRAFT_204322 [Colletotrichum cereale]|nr:hypothetical protein LZ30DRAFT_204322 [Colletotrichum cereale]